MTGKRLSTAYDIDRFPDSDVFDPIAWFEGTGEDLGLPPGWLDDYNRICDKARADIQRERAEKVDLADFAPDELVVLHRLLAKFNPNHEPAGSPEGGEFASAGDAGAEGRAMTLDGGKTHTNTQHFDQVKAFWDKQYTPAERDAVNRATADYVANSDVRIRVPTDILYAIMGGERGGETGVQNQFQTGTSGGLLDEGRVNAESRLFFGTTDKEPEERPIYAYLGNPKDPPPWVDQYGDAVLVLKDSVRDRTTFTLGDSFNIDNGLPIPLSQAGSLGYLAADQRVDPTDVTNWANGMGGDYVEAQVHGGVQPSDIDHVVFTISPPGEGTTYWLDDAGVPWTMAGHGAPLAGENNEFDETGPVPVEPGSV